MLAPRGKRRSDVGAAYLPQQMPKVTILAWDPTPYACEKPLDDGCRRHLGVVVRAQTLYRAEKFSREGRPCVLVRDMYCLNGELSAGSDLKTKNTK